MSQFFVFISFSIEYISRFQATECTVDWPVVSNAFDEAFVNEQSDGAQLQSARLATRRIQHRHNDGRIAATGNATFLSHLAAYVATEFRVSDQSIHLAWLIGLFHVVAR